MGLPSWHSVQLEIRREMEAHSSSRRLTGTGPGGNDAFALIHRQLFPLSKTRSGREISSDQTLTQSVGVRNRGR
jgi:hypothetical protein